MTAPFLVLAPDGRDAEVIRLVLAEVGIGTREYVDLPALCAGMQEDASALLLSEGALAAGMDELAACLGAQPPWSDIPVLVLTARGALPPSRARWELFRRLGNVTLLARPLHAEALQSAAQAAVRARLRQYRTRSHLAQIAEANTLLERRVEERTRDLQIEMAERLRVEEVLRQSQKMEAVGQLTGGIAHDFNNLLQVVLGNLQALRDKLSIGDDDLLRHIRMAFDAGDRAATLTRRLLAFARRQPLAPASLDLNALVGTMWDLVLRSVGESIRVETALSPELWRSWADGNQVENALLNLVINARDAMPDGGVLRIETANAVLDENFPARVPEFRPGRYVMLRVVDTGTGMPPEVLERAFEPFFTTKPMGQGTGLGLSQLYGFARQSGGVATISSKPDGGTAVSLYLPRHENPIEAEQMPAALPEGDPPAPGRGETILVVEDEVLVLMLWTETLAGQGYRILEAAEPRTAIGILDSDARIDLLVTDVGLPGMTGRELAEVARAGRPDLKVLFLTGYAQHAAFERDALGPRTRMLTKPVALDRLLSTVRSLLDERTS
jgi:signal transduction histidine kinase/CheY-like chemotaxis protein